MNFEPGLEPANFENCHPAGALPGTSNGPAVDMLIDVPAVFSSVSKFCEYALPLNWMLVVCAVADCAPKPNPTPPLTAAAEARNSARRVPARDVLKSDFVLVLVICIFSRPSDSGILVGARRGRRAFRLPTR